MYSCPLERHSCLQHVPKELANFFFKYEIHPSNHRGINWELPQLMNVEVDSLSNTTDLRQGQQGKKFLRLFPATSCRVYGYDRHPQILLRTPVSSLLWDKAALRWPRTLL